MAIPKVFISSTCYDLKYIRENLKYFVKTLGYEPILSEDGSIFYNPAQHTQDACLTEIPNSQLFVLIIGGRYGGKYQQQEESVTNMEYREAVRLHIPVFALVESAVYNDHHLYSKNLHNDKIKIGDIKFPSVDSVKIFSFIDEVRKNGVNNALVPFRDFGDIESYLRQQWAGMMFSFLSEKNEQKRVEDTLNALSKMNSTIEMLSKQILVSVGTEDAKIDAALYEEMIASEAIRDFSYWKVRPTPVHILVNGSFRTCAKSLNVDFRIDEDDKGISISPSGKISRKKFDNSSNEYKALRQKLVDILKEAGTTPERYLSKRPRIEEET